MAELPVDSLLSVADAIRILDALPIAPPREEVVDLHDADGRVLAEDVVADRDYPPFDKSLVDGYAVRSGDGVSLRCIGEVAAGNSFDHAIGPGECVAIMTGAPLPAGADAAVPIEKTRRQQRGTGFQPVAVSESRVGNPCHDDAGDVITIESAARPGQFVARRGSDLAAGTIALSRGTMLGPAQLAVLAQVGSARVRVFARPRAAILITGDEIVDVASTPAGSQIRDCNSHLLRSLLTRLGCDVVHVARCKDTREATRAAIETCIAQSDVTFITGGMSMGAYDFVPSTLLDLGFYCPIKKIRIKPGKPFVAGARFPDGDATTSQTAPSGRELARASEPPASKLAATPDFPISEPRPANRNPSPPPTAHHTLHTVFGLPGNPVSAFCCTARLAARVIDRLRGLPAPRERFVVGPLARDLPANGPREFYQPAILRDDGSIDPLDWKGSADVFTLARADALLVRSEGNPAQRAGDWGRALVIP
jgi:molybdopterin molybdotransferase